jgi:hypothetical protein
MSGPKYENRRVRHRPRQAIHRDRIVAFHGEPACGQPNAPGSTSVDESRINCADCLLLKGNS